MSDQVAVERLGSGASGCEEAQSVSESIKSLATLFSQMQALQQSVDENHWVVSSSNDRKRRHIGFHVTIAAAKLARVEERFDHDEFDDDVVADVAADLMIYALQLANLRGEDLATLVEGRLVRIVSGALVHQTP